MDAVRVFSLCVLVVLSGCASFVGGPQVTTPATPSDATTATTQPSTATPTATPEPTPEPRNDSLVVTVTAVASGDTLLVEHPNGSLDRVRLLGVDAPSTDVPPDPTAFAGVPDSASGEDCLRDVGRSAEGLLIRQLRGQEVGLAFDPDLGRRDDAGRLQAYLTFDGELVNLALVRQGFGRVPPGSFGAVGPFVAAQAEARAGGRGVWTCVARQVAVESPVAVERIHPNAEGSAHDYDFLNDEFLVLNNTGDEVVNLTGWTVTDAEGHSFSFPHGFELRPGRTVTIHTGRGRDTARQLFWGFRIAVWDNDRDVVIVRRPDGSVALREPYERG